jgi:hypothetical protein
LIDGVDGLGQHEAAHWVESPGRDLGAGHQMQHMGVLDPPVLSEDAGAQRSEPGGVTVVHPYAYRHPGGAREPRQLAERRAAGGGWLLCEDRHSAGDCVANHLLVAAGSARRDDGIDSAKVRCGRKGAGRRHTHTRS